MAIGQIPWDRIIDYARFHELEKDVEQAFVQVIREMDVVYLDWVQEEQERERQERAAANASPV